MENFIKQSKIKECPARDSVKFWFTATERLWILFLCFDWIFGMYWLGSLEDYIYVNACKNVRWPINGSRGTYGYYKFDPERPSNSKDMYMNDVIFGSQHSGGANFCNVDGSVHFLQDSIDFTVYQSMATRNGEEVFSP